MLFFVVALLHPEFQTIAQEELDAITRREQCCTSLPTHGSEGSRQRGQVESLD